MTLASGRRLGRTRLLELLVDVGLDGAAAEAITGAAAALLIPAIALSSVAIAEASAANTFVDNPYRLFWITIGYKR
ncbi:MAG: hypothetical protein AB7U61_03090 [Methylocystis sp.]